MASTVVVRRLKWCSTVPDQPSNWTSNGFDVRLIEQQQAEELLRRNRVTPRPGLESVRISLIKQKSFVFFLVVTNGLV